MALKMGNAEIALNEYMALFSRFGRSKLPESIVHHVDLKMAKAAELLDQQRPELMQAAVALQAAARGMQSRRSTPKGDEKTYLAKLHSAVAANKSGNYIEARELFLDIYCLKGHMESRLSAANMTFKLGEVHAALAEYVRIHSLRASLGSRGQTVLDAKHSEATEIAKHLGLPHSPTVTRTLRVPEDVGFGKSRWGLQLISIADRPCSAEELARFSRLQADVRDRAAPRLTPTPEQPAAEDPESDLGKAVASRAIERALDGASRLSASPVSLSGSATSDPGEAAALTIQKVRRGAKARAHLRQTKLYIAKLQEGQKANKSGDYATARDAFLDAYDVSGRVEPRISATNMLLKLEKVDEAIREYEDLLEEERRDPGLLSAAAREVVTRKLNEALELLVVMQSASSNGDNSPRGVQVDAEPVHAEHLRNGNSNGHGRSHAKQQSTDAAEADGWFHFLDLSQYLKSPVGCCTTRERPYGDLEVSPGQRQQRVGHWL